MTEPKDIEGGCQCGAVRYAIHGKIVGVIACHCLECQRQSGSAFGMSMIVPAESLELTAGPTKSFTRSADSGATVTCHFCGECGTRIYHAPSAQEGLYNVKPGTLDDTSVIKVDATVWTSRKQSWFDLPPGLPKFAKNPH